MPQGKPEAKKQSSLTLYIPGLQGPFSTQWQTECRQDIQAFNKSSLVTLLSRAEKKHEPSSDFYQKAQLLLTGDNEHAVPVAAYRFHYSSNAAASEKWCINCDPAFIQPDRDQAVLVDLEDELHDAEASLFAIDKINKHYADEPWVLHFISPHRWLIVSDKKYDIATTALSKVKNKNINDALPAGDDARYWHQILNEIQMLIYQMSNLPDSSGRDFVFNSVWLWGHGNSGDPVQYSNKTVYTDDEEIQCMAAVHGMKTCSLESFDENSNHYSELVISNKLHTAQNLQDFPLWLNHLEILNQNLFTRIESGLKQNKWNEVSIVTDETVYNLKPKHLRRWWKRRKSLDNFIVWN